MWVLPLASPILDLILPNRRWKRPVSGSVYHCARTGAGAHLRRHRGVVDRVLALCEIVYAVYYAYCSLSSQIRVVST